MYMIVKYLPRSLTIDSLADGLHPLLKSGFFRRKGEIRAIKFVALANKERRIVERHALVRLCSEPVKLKLIKAVNQSDIRRMLLSPDEFECLPKALIASDYVVRSWRNDRRQIASLYPQVPDRRQSERRRSGFSIYPLVEKCF